jgi:hypothetical protein
MKFDKQSSILVIRGIFPVLIIIFSSLTGLDFHLPLVIEIVHEK